jgi:hypothetical protein
MPTIFPPTSILGYKQWDAWAYQPFASGLLANPQANNANLGTLIATAHIGTSTTLAAFTYANGTAGVGATITLDATGTLTCDTRVTALGDLVLVLGQTPTYVNGLYLVTTAGATGVAAVLTRSTLLDTPGKFVGHIYIAGGSALGGRIYLCPQPAPVTIGTSPIVFVQWSNRWQSSPLPPGMTLNIATGRISGAAEEAGIYNVGLLASADSGATWSDVLNITIGIEPTAYARHSGVSLFIDAQTGEVTVPSGPLASGALFGVKRGDDRLIYTQIRTQGVVLDLDTIPTMKFGLKEYETERILQMGGGDADTGSPVPLHAIGEGTSRTYILYVKFDDEKLEKVLPSYEDDAGTRFVALAEIEWLEANDAGAGGATLRRTSRTFKVEIDRDLIPDA